MDDYDVIIIGTGAGGGTLARHLAPSGKRILLLERGDWLPREPRTGTRTTSSSTTATSRPTPGTTATAGRSSRRSTTSSAARRSSTARRSTGCARRTSASCSHHDGISPAWPISYDDLEPYYTLAEQHYEVHGARGEDPTEPPASAPYPFPAVSHEPRIQRLARPARGGRLPPVPRAVRRPPRRGEPALQPLRPLLHLRRLPVPRAREVGRRGARRPAGARARERHAADERAGRSSSRPTPSGTDGDGGRRRARRRGASGTRRRSSSSPAARPTPRSCCSPPRTTSIRTASPTAPTRSAATTCSTRARRCSRSRATRTRPSSRRRSG